MSNLLWVEQGAAGHLCPIIIIWDQFVVHQTVNAVRLHDGTLIQLVFIWRSCRYSENDTEAHYC